MLGIGVVTYNRLETLSGSIAAIRACTDTSYQLMVSDDGSTDGTLAWLEENKVPHIKGSNYGTGWNRNRALYYFENYTDCEVVILLEDDCYPSELGWYKPWVKGAQRWGHLCYPHFKGQDEPLSGDGTPENPFLYKNQGNQCVAVSRAALAAVGYSDTRFHGYGHDDTEWRLRYARWNKTLRKPATLGLLSGVTVVPSKSFWNVESVTANGQLLSKIMKEDVLYKPPYRDQAEKERFLAEIETIGPDLLQRSSK